MSLIIHDGTDHFERGLKKALRTGRVHRIHKGIYVEASPEALISTTQKHWNALVARVAPGSVLTDRTALEGAPTRDADTGVWHVFVSAPQSRNVFRLPGLVINLREGVGPADTDTAYINVRMASLARRMLDNLTTSRARSGPTRTVGRTGVEIALDEHAARNGLASLSDILNDAIRIAPEIDREAELITLREIITAFVENRPKDLKTRTAQARSRGLPEDDAFLAKFAKTLDGFSQHRIPEVPDIENTWEKLRESAFIEAYFSNYIEGTQFLMDEARDIAVENKPTTRVKDGHDIQATFELLLNQPKTSVREMHFEAFIEALRAQHAVLMRGRPEVEPGMFKSKPNRAGMHLFVDPKSVIGTMQRAWATLADVRDPFAGAMGLHYLIAGVHPFTDGNGRISRLFMTQELRAQGLSRIVVPTISRQSYIAGLRNISDRADVFTFMRSMETFQRITAACVSGDAGESHRLWASTYAFCDDEKRANLQPPSLDRPLRNDSGLLAPRDYWFTLGTTGIGRLLGTD